ncbi:zinc finger and BTB domain-containing protein 41-like isoform X2 [Tachypleus tridentatus]|uniref:zinc finger and BTB domain-containing protein 41-like isoform X2 n=1 Tax=Tachypleus tridentatus TaxID=6853 RepID=UPI003FD34325
MVNTDLCQEWMLDTLSESPMINHNNSFSCDMCPKVFKSKKFLMQHKEFHEDTVHECPYCHSTFVYKRNLQYHMKRICHRMHPPHLLSLHHMEGRESALLSGRANVMSLPICPICGKSFKAKQNLKQHMQIHGQKLTCTVCHATFRFKSSLFRHQRRFCPVRRLRE